MTARIVASLVCICNGGGGGGGTERPRPSSCSWGVGKKGDL